MPVRGGWDATTVNPRRRIPTVMPGVCVSLWLIARCVAVNVVPTLTVVADTVKDPVYWPPTNAWDGDAATVRAASASPAAARPRAVRERRALAIGMQRLTDLIRISSQEAAR